MMNHSPFPNLRRRVDFFIVIGSSKVDVEHRANLQCKSKVGSSKVDVEYGVNSQCKSKACFLPCFRQFEIRRMFTLQLQRQKNKKIRPWERSHWKADKICHRIQSAHDFGTYFFVFKIYPKT